MNSKINIKVSYPDTINFPNERNQERFIRAGALLGNFMDELARFDFDIVRMDIEIVDKEMNGLDD